MCVAVRANHAARNRPAYASVPVAADPIPAAESALLGASKSQLSEVALFLLPPILYLLLKVRCGASKSRAARSRPAYASVFAAADPVPESVLPGASKSHAPRSRDVQALPGANRPRRGRSTNYAQPDAMLLPLCSC